MTGIRSNISAFPVMPGAGVKANSSRMARTVGLGNRTADVRMMCQPSGALHFRYCELLGMIIHTEAVRLTVVLFQVT